MEILPSLYREVAEQAKKMGETNDCSVRALALTTGRPYAEVHAALKAAGRKDGHGTYTPQLHAAAKALGFHLIAWTRDQMIEMMKSYPGADPERVVKNKTWITPKHLTRFEKQWAPHKPFPMIWHTVDHSIAVVGGRPQDWTTGRSHRITRIFRVVKI